MIYAFDFDGVLCDSARETGMAGMATAEQALGFPPPTDRERVLRGFEAARPCLETGWEAVLMCAALATSAGTAEDLVARFQHGLKEELLLQYGQTEEALKTAFAATRDAWIARDRQDWLSSHTFFPEAVQAVQALLTRGGDVAIITTKGTSFTLELLTAAGLNVPPERVFGLEAGKKWDTLTRLLAEVAPTQGIFFIEDRLKTLEEVQARLPDAPLHLAFATWGYNTPADAQRARDLGYTVLAQSELAGALAHVECYQHRLPTRNGRTIWVTQS